MNPYRILIAEDDSILLNQLKNLLIGVGYDVDTAANGKEALDLWENSIYDVILLDLAMPDVNGREVLNTVKNEQPFTQIIVVSGQGEKEDLIDAVNAHIYKYIEKGQDLLEEILTSVEEAIRNRHPVLLSLESMVKKGENEPFLLSGNQSYTPKKLYDEVRKNTSFGKQYFKTFEESLIEYIPVDESIDDQLGIKGVI